MNVADYYKIGLVMKPHGLKGEVTISLDDYSEQDFSSIKSVFLKDNQRLVPYFIEYVSVRASKAFAKFEDINTPEEALKISKRAIYLPKSARPKSGRGQFYDDEVIHFEVHDKDIGLLGKVTEVIPAGPNKLLSLDHKGKEVLIPVNSPFITSINKSKMTINVSLPEGFLDI